MPSDRPNDDAHERLVRIEDKLDNVLDQVRRINGRVNGLENWRREQELEQARRQGRSEAVVTRSQLALIGALIPAASALVGILSRYVW